MPRGHPRARVDTHVVDLADAGGHRAVADAVRAAHPRMRLLVNNAGVALGGRFDQVTLEEFEWVIDINFRSVVRLTHALLPALKAEPGSHLVNVSSLFGLVAPAGQAAYSASKFAVRGFTEALRQELADEVGVTACTRAASGPGSPSPPGSAAACRRRSTRPAARRSRSCSPSTGPRRGRGDRRGIERRRPRVLIGWSAKVPDLLARLLPAAHGPVYGAAQGLLKVLTDREIRRDAARDRSAVS